MSILEIRSLQKRFGRVEAVRDVSLTVESGQIYGLLGPNGSGKTTTLACALGLLRESSGSIRILGEPPAKLHRTRGRVGVVFDEPALISGLRVSQNLSYARRLLGHSGGRSPDEALRLTGIADLAARRAGKLSLGQRKRVAIARALLGSPELLVLDEPLSALDSPGVAAMLRLFRRLAAEGLTLVLSSHRLHEMEAIVSHVGILDGGRLLLEGALDELLAARRGRYRLRVSRPESERVLARIAQLGSIECLEQKHLESEPEEAGLELLLQLDGRPVAELNRALVEAGLAVSGIVPEHSGLPALFDAHVESRP